MRWRTRSRSELQRAEWRLKCASKRVLPDPGGPRTSTSGGRERAGPVEFRSSSSMHLASPVPVSPAAIMREGGGEREREREYVVSGIWREQVEAPGARPALDHNEALREAPLEGVLGCSQMQMCVERATRDAYHKLEAAVASLALCLSSPRGLLLLQQGVDRVD